MSTNYGYETRSTGRGRRDSEPIGRRGGRQEYSRDSEEIYGGDEERYWRQQRDEDYGSRGRQGYYSSYPESSSRQGYGGYEASGYDEAPRGGYPEETTGSGNRGDYGERRSQRSGQSQGRGGYRDYETAERQRPGKLVAGHDEGEYGRGSYGYRSGEGQFRSSQYGSRGYGNENYGSGGYGSRGEGYGSGESARGNYGGEDYGSVGFGAGRSYRASSRSGGGGFQSDLDSQDWSGSDSGRYGSGRSSQSHGGQHYGKGPRGYQRSDDRIQEEINECLTYDAELDASEIDVTVSKGEVTLTGHVDSRRAKRRAEDLAEEIRGVTEVHNQLRTSRESQGAGAAGRSESTAGRESGKSEKTLRSGT